MGLDAKVKEEWVAALRSGEYEQGYGVLRRGLDRDRYCCLGVLHDTLGGAWARIDGQDTWAAIRDNGGYNEAILPASEARIAGLDMDTQDTLTHLNDTERWTFGQIADYVEENL